MRTGRSGGHEVAVAITRRKWPIYLVLVFRRHIIFSTGLMNGAGWWFVICWLEKLCCYTIRALCLQCIEIESCLQSKLKTATREKHLTSLKFRWRAQPRQMIWYFVVVVKIFKVRWLHNVERWLSGSHGKVTNIQFVDAFNREITKFSTPTSQPQAAQGSKNRHLSVDN